jgi:hypothetical protein
MPLFLIALSNDPVANNERLKERLLQSNATRLLENVWLSELPAQAENVRDVLADAAGPDDRYAVIELQPGAHWAASENVFMTGIDWLQQKVRP